MFKYIRANSRWFRIFQRDYVIWLILWGGGYSWSFDFVEIWVVVLSFDIGIKTDLHFDSPMINPPDIKSKFLIWFRCIRPIWWQIEDKQGFFSLWPLGQPYKGIQFKVYIPYSKLWHALLAKWIRQYSKHLSVPEKKTNIKSITHIIQDIHIGACNFWEILFSKFYSLAF